MAYAAAKAGVVQLSRDLGVHLARSGVRVNAVLFGPIATQDQRGDPEGPQNPHYPHSMTRKSPNHARQPYRLRRTRKDSTPAGRENGGFHPAPRGGWSEVRWPAAVGGRTR
ncbi:SDR family oxidoreductase [Nonomuraea helvata]|uniref:SDR family oxidoreductase n=1 Tax=Nonomuraea helvata TaxID=37484 RepID=A0ABV5RTW8_9ACTN